MIPGSVSTYLLEDIFALPSQCTNLPL